ncbi:SspB-related isopeptide-forming adhesin [Limosilactobacillus reuteri]|uniref:SspB-related isopeptide-forming adhesin n=1 Tax=Limosilactobacillus reuteri TaxID=1598 RepID=UPI001E546041|nr:SspB-related isopeptide-forming adhesin [Limosilactobacillus reuteri]UFK69192.1 hypothetical protein IVR12_02303 [Limosilactobacillus reuteri]
MRNKIEAVNSAQTNFKMYKKGKQWLFASAVALVALGATSVASTAHADTTTSDQPQVATTQASGNGNQETITTYPHKDQIDQAVQSVQNTPHLSVTQDPDQTITGSSQAEIDQKIQDDYNQQQQYLKQRQDEAKRSAMQQSNYQTYNETHGDTRQLDQDVKDAQNIPGLTVVKDSDTDSSFDAEDTTGLKNWATNTQKNYQSQGDEIHKAIDTQKQNYAKYQSQLNDLAKDQHVTGQVNWDNGGYMNAHPTYDITWHYDLQRKKVVVTNVHLTIPSGLAPKTGGGFWDTYVIKRAIDPAPVKDPTRWPFGKQGDATGVDGNSLKEKYFPGSLAFYAHNNKTQEEVKAIKDYHGSYDAIQNPDGTWSLITIYDRSGTSIQHDYPRYGDPAWAEWGETAPVATVTLPKLNTTSANYHYNTAKVSKPSMPNEITASYHYNVVNYTPNVDKHFTDGTNIADHQVFSDGSVATASIKTTLPVAADIQGGLKNFTITENYSNYAQYVGTATFKVTDDNGNDVTDQWNINDNKQGLATISLKDPSTANGQTVTIVPTWTINKDVPNGSTFKNVATVTVNDVPGTPSETTIQTFTQNPTKDVELGDDVQGDTPSSINGQVIASGSEVTYPLSDKNGLPANRAQDITSHVVTDTLDSGLEYVGYKAYLLDANGTLQDITNHVLLTKDGQNLTFTDDNYLLGLYNKDKGTEFKTPIIDLVAKATAATKTIPNKFESLWGYKDANGENTEKKTSNTVNVSTFTPTATKDVELGDDVQGDTENSIAGSLVEAGTVVTWPLSVSPLPANRAEDLTSRTITENLDSNLTFVGYNAYLLDKDNKLQDITNLVHLKQDGQKLTFTDDDQLLKQYNANKTESQSLPVIDLRTKVNGESKLIPNKFDQQTVFKDGKGNATLKTTSNQASIKTATAPAPVKEDLSDSSQKIDGQKVDNDQNINYQMTWDLSNSKDVNTTPDMIKKGFYFADPIDTNALTVNDLSKAQVVDQDGKKVNGITFHKYTSLSQAPEFIQEQIKDNHLAGRFNGTFVVAQADDPQEFFDKYVKTGSKLKVQLPVKVNKEFEGSFSNTAYQFGFGKATPTNTVTNYVKPTPAPEEKLTPKTPETPAPTSTPASTPTPAVQRTAEPTAAPVSASQPISVAPSQTTSHSSEMPQTGNKEDNIAVMGLAAVSLAGSLGLASLGIRKRKA